MKAAAKRCAIYTRKSTEEGLDQAFNSLHAQREACQAYVLSQAGEGWEALPTLYDDGGFTGGNMDRPGLKALLADVDAGRVDVIVVYKVDRLTRSLADFAKIVERLDGAGASFVSVTQAFNTTNSMGRLTLNVLLSFAQFEREVTSERIRDKIALSKAKGMWMGGRVPLGYDIADKKLVVNPTEAATVRRIFRRYLELRSVHELRNELERQGVRSKVRMTQDGRTLGGGVLNRGAVFHLLQSRIYVGEISHREKHHPGAHEPIVPAELFKSVQSALADNRPARGRRTVGAAAAPLAGKIFDSEGRRMTPTFSYGKAGRPYRYYTSIALQTGGDGSADGLKRLGADAVERFLGEQLQRLLGRTAVTPRELEGLVDRVEVGREQTDVLLSVSRIDPKVHADLLFKDLCQRAHASEDIVWEDERREQLRVRLPLRLKLRGGRTLLDGERYVAGKARRNNSLVHALKVAHRALANLDVSPISPLSNIEGAATAPTCPHQRRLSGLTFLAPNIQRQILDGAHPKGLELKILTVNHPPLAWADQAAWLGVLAQTAS